MITINESDYLPLGATHDPRAPYNQCDPEPVERDIVAEFSLSTCKTTGTTNYYCEGDKYEGYYEVLDNVDWYEEYSEQHYTPLELINKFKEFLTEVLSHTENKSKQWEIKKLIQECENWDEECNDVYEDK